MNLDHVFNDLPVSEVRRFLAEYRFRLDQLTFTEITIRLYQEGNKVRWTQSHYIKAPQLAGPYMPDLTFDDTPESALRSAVMSIIREYQIALKNGDQPADEWLVPNASFH